MHLSLLFAGSDPVDVDSRTRGTVIAYLPEAGRKGVRPRQSIGGWSDRYRAFG
jgi:hypothetical protein